MVTNTYWYLQAVPELMAVAAKRFECARRPNFDHPCRLNADQGWKAAS
jgi:hypothetical protein